MPYTINKSDGTILTTIADGTRDTTTSLSLAGPNFVGYGEYLNENLVYLLENFASNIAPSSVNLQGQLWFDKSSQILKVFTSQGYVAVSGVTNSGSQPSLGKNGDIWYNQSTEQMYVYDTSGTPGFKIVGPAYTKQQGISGAIPASIEDGSISGFFHNVLRLQYGNLTYATINADPSFLPTPAIPGFTFINPGITFSSNVVGASINANVVTPNGQTILVDIVRRQITGNLHGNVVATTLSGNLTGNVSSLVSQATNFSSTNVVITGGYINNLSNLTSTLATITVLNSGTTQAANLSTANILVASGTVTGLTNFSTQTGQAINFSTSNILVTSGNVSGTVGINNEFTLANLINSVATTKSANDSTSAVATTAFVHSVLPTGIIVMWNSTASSIPEGWQLCDGSNGTPDLRGQFIVGAGGSYAFGDTGGSASVTLSANAMPIHTHVLSGSLTTGSAGSHSHSATVTDPGHNHTIGIQGGQGSVNAANSLVGDPSQDTGRRTNSKTTGISVSLSTVLDHSHSLTLSGNTQSAGGSGGTTQPHENRPPYYALCYIQKMY